MGLDTKMLPALCPTLETVMWMWTVSGSRVDVEADGPAAETDPSNLPKDQTLHIPWEDGGSSFTSHTFVSCEALCPL